MELKDSKTKKKASTKSLADDDDDDKKLQRKRKREERAALLDRVPKVHPETGLSFTKQQLRRMCKRLARGLDPIETPQEVEERKQRENELKREEEAELAGLDDDKNDNDKAKEENNEEPRHDPSDSMNEKDDDDDDEQINIDSSEVPTQDNSATPPQAKKQKRSKKRSKPVPVDYTCQACQNNHLPAHWIYDCPSKVTMPGTNQVSKHKNVPGGIHNPDQRKVFVSGLPFEATKQDVVRMFENQSKEVASAKPKVVSCKLITFSDTNRCKGQAILTFDTEMNAALALKQMNGKIIDVASDEKGKRKQSKSDKTVAATTNKAKKQLKLKVSKLLNRAITKKKQQQKQHKKKQ